MINIEKAKEEILKSRELGGPMMAKYFTDVKTNRYNDLFNANKKEENIEKEEEIIAIDEIVKKAIN